MIKLFRYCNLILFCLCSQFLLAQSGDYKTHSLNEHQVLFETETENKLQISFYQDDLIRFHWVRKGEDFFADDRYEMVEQHRLSGEFELEEHGGHINISTEVLELKIDKSPFRIRIKDKSGELLEEKNGIRWSGDSISIGFEHDRNEHFAGMGHEAFGWVESIDLRGKEVSSNYGEGKKKSDWGAQGVLTVPFFLSSKGYGIFLNSTYNHKFNFGRKKTYEFGFDTSGFPGQMDFFFIYGPDFRDILDNYTALTGRPRLPQRTIFGLQLSDKGEPEHSGAEWWKKKVKAHREAGFPLDHMVNDNRWRAGTGAWSGSWFEWDSTRVPDPKAFDDWIKENNLSVTLDHNRNNAELSAGWKPEFNLPYAEESGVKEPHSAPDYSNPEMRNWIWELFWSQSLNPELDYPGDALWIDETDELWKMKDTIILANGRSWAENENYYPFLIAKAIVQEGWDNENNNLPPGIGEAKRPFVWARSGMAGGQRYMTHWTGDIKCDYRWMKAQVRAMQASGLSGFPFFNHDAGGFRHPGPEDHMYMNWAMAFGSFSPIWRPHGPGENSRWPLDRQAAAREAAMKFAIMRYEMMPYIYSYAHIAQKTGVPMARAMIIDHQDEPQAWRNDLQYMWGNEILVAPMFSKSSMTQRIWLPKGKWYRYDNLKKIKGGKIINEITKTGQLPLFIKEGAIIPKYRYAKSTSELDPTHLILEVYTGADGSFNLYEDDNVTEKYRTQNEIRITRFELEDDRFTVHPSTGNYAGAPEKRDFEIIFKGEDKPRHVSLNEKQLDWKEDKADIQDGEGAFWDASTEELLVSVKNWPVDKELVIER
ncbi:DUF4968 domain-containing protein [Gramella sp. BOM4]|nr:DUF4968 domain-containing protein [Christiangramia bathymodioli]